MALANINELLLVYTTYFIATASPGPSNMAIMGTAMKKGRAPALAMASGVVVSSMIWACLAAAGILTLLATFAELLFALKIIGGLYLLWLAFKAGKSALKPVSPAQDPATTQYPAGYTTMFRQGILMHITNPKAILTWVAIMSVALKPGAASASLPAIVLGCAAICITVFSGYAVLFSTALMIGLYRKIQRGLDGVLAICFTLAGLRLLTGRN
jgi:threonine/homoserine/homoserine lactone efflux protein